MYILTKVYIWYLCRGICILNPLFMTKVRTHNLVLSTKLNPDCIWVWHKNDFLHPPPFPPPHTTHHNPNPTLPFHTFRSLWWTFIEHNYIWLEYTRKCITVSQMSPDHIHVGGSPGLIFNKKIHHKDICTNTSCFCVCARFFHTCVHLRLMAEKTCARTKTTRACVFVHISLWKYFG